MAEELGTIWVCQNCMMHHCSGECGGCHDEHDAEPWSRLDDNETVTMDDVEREDLGTHPCQGCGSSFHGERYSFTLWDEATYKVIRFFRDSSRNYTIKTGLTRAEAQEHCNDPETSSSTCTNAEGKRRTARSGPWFDGWTEE